MSGLKNNALSAPSASSRAQRAAFHRRAASAALVPEHEAAPVVADTASPRRSRVERARARRRRAGRRGRPARREPPAGWRRLQPARQRQRARQLRAGEAGESDDRRSRLARLRPAPPRRRRRRKSRDGAGEAVALARIGDRLAADEELDQHRRRRRKTRPRRSASTSAAAWPLWSSAMRSQPAAIASSAAGEKVSGPSSASDNEIDAALDRVRPASLNVRRRVSTLKGFRAGAGPPASREMVEGIGREVAARFEHALVSRPAVGERRRADKGDRAPAVLRDQRLRPRRRRQLGEPRRGDDAGGDIAAATSRPPQMQRALRGRDDR